MVKNVLSRILFIVICGLAIVIYGCGPNIRYIPATVPPDKAVIYIYRPSNFHGAAVEYAVFIEDKHICNMTNETYFPYISKPGRIKVWTTLSPQTPLYVDVEAGNSYYIKTGYAGLRQGLGQTIITSVDPMEAEKEISKCCLIL